MKKINSIVMLVAAAAMAFVSCQKQENFAPEVSSEDVVLTFASEKPAFEDETKTEWTGSSIQWSTGDKIAIAYTVAGNWQNASGDADSDARLYKSEPLKEATETAQFNVSTYFTGTTVGSHVFYGVYPAPDATTFNAAPVATLEVPINQTPGSASFDGAADLMTGVSVGEFTSRPAAGETISMKWTRLVAHANITLKALNGVTEGETISTITLTAQEGANLVGSQKVNIQTNEVTNNNNESNVVVLNGGNLAVDASGNIEFWACFLPVTLTSLKVEVETNEAIYTREIDLSATQKTFAKNARNVLSIKMDTATRVAKTEDTSDYSGEWLIAGKEGETWYAAQKYVSGNYLSVTGLKFEGESIFESTGLSDCYMHIEKVAGGDYDGMYTIIDAGGKYLSTSSTSSNNMKAVAELDDNSYWDIELNDDGETYSIVATKSGNRNHMRFNYNNGTNPRVSCYQSTTTQPCLKLFSTSLVKADTTPSITVEETLELTSAEAEGTISVTYKNLEELEVAAYSDAECTTKSDWLVASWKNNAVTYSASANEGEERTAYIRIYALDSEANEYTKVITVSQAGKAAEGESGWIATAFADLKAGDQVVIVATKGTNSWALSDANGTSDAPAAVTITYSGNKLTSDPSDEIVWYVGGDASGRIFYADAANGSKWLYCTNANNGVRVGTNEANTFVLDATSGYLKHGGTSRYLGVYTTNPDWRCYTSINDNIKNQTFLFFVKTGEGGGETPVDPVQLTMSDITCSAQTENSLTFTWPAVANASKYEVTFNNGTAEEVTTTSYTATGLTASTSYTISVKAVGDGTNYTTSEAKTQTGTTGGGNDGGDTTGGTHYVKVTSTPADWSGTYLIVYEDGNVAFNGALDKLDATSNTVSVTISDNQIEATVAMNAAAFTINNDGHIQAKSGKYVGNSNDSNALPDLSTAATNTLSIDASGNFVVNSAGGSYLRYNATSGQTRFRYYKSTSYTNQKAIQLYKLN